MVTRNGSKHNTTHSLAMVVRNKVPSLLLLAFRPELKQEKLLLERLSHRHWKAISMRVGIGLGDTYGPMHYPGMRSLWQSPANFHQHLAFPTPSSFTRPSYLVPFFSSYTSSFPCLPAIVPGWWKREKKSLLSSECGRGWRCAITLHCFSSW